MSNISKDLVGNVFGKDIHSPIDRVNVRELVAFKEEFINDLMAQKKLNKKQAQLDAEDMVLAFCSTLKSEDAEIFKKLYEEENLAVLSTESYKAEQVANIEANFLEANFIFNELSANLKVFGSNSSLAGANPANIDLGLQHINRCLEVEPNNPKYLNLKGLLLAQGKKELQEGLKFIEKAAELDPNNINIQHNLKTLKDPNGCFIATAAYGTPFVYEIEELRNWRDRSLSRTSYGKIFIRNYYKYSPPFANYISEKKNLKKAVRILLKPLIRYAKFANRK